MTITLSRYHTMQTKLGLFTNLWPTALSKRDRQTIGGWYLVAQLGTWRLDICCQTAR